ncbi:hypothetical protein NW765_014947 [Fusarium oxysporum]|nr:hypothetical protein NW765_014947 [Fusarium oxysporum]KAJ4279600.1 hypothetical protein NW764_006978 [Fusarium oxysporum]
MPRTVFKVAMSQQQLDIIIHSQDLQSDLKSLFLIDLGGVNEIFDGKSLLKHYTALTTRLDDLRSSGDVLKTTGDLIKEWQLLVEGFLGNLSVFRLFGFQELCNYEVLDNRLRKAFAQQELEYDIDLFHQKFIKIDDHHKAFRYAMSRWLPLDPMRLQSQEEIIAQQEYRKDSYIITFRQENYSRSEWPCSEKDKLLKIINEDSRRAKERLPRFRFRFIYQYRLLEKATTSQDPSTTLSQLAGQLQGYKQAFNAAMRTMRRLSRLTPPESLLDTLCFLSVARAVAETDEGDGNVCISAFTQDLEQWIQTLPDIEEAARLMWGITFDFDPQPQSTARQLCHNSMLQLRDSVAALIGKSNELFDLGAQSRHDEMHVLSAFHQQRQRNNDQTSPTVEPSDSPITARAKEPPDRLICPITSLQEKVQDNPRFNRVVIILATSIIFALVVYFMLGFAHILSATVLGLPNPWYTGMAQTTSAPRSTPSATFFTGYEQASSQEFDSATHAAQPASNPVQATILFDDIFDYEKFSADSAAGKGLFEEAEKF